MKKNLIEILLYVDILLLYDRPTTQRRKHTEGNDVTIQTGVIV